MDLDNKTKIGELPGKIKKTCSMVEHKRILQVDTKGSARTRMSPGSRSNANKPMKSAFDYIEEENFVLEDDILHKLDNNCDKQDNK